MKKIFSLVLAFSFTYAAMAQTKPDDVMKVNTDKHDFGNVVQNVPVTYFFELKNTSDKPLVVENTSATCGCTTPEKIVKPIMPGETVKLKVEYNAAAAGPINKQVMIKLAGIDEVKTVSLAGMVLTPEVYAEYVKTKPESKKN